MGWLALLPAIIPLFVALIGLWRGFTSTESQRTREIRNIHKEHMDDLDKLERAAKKAAKGDADEFSKIAASIRDRARRAVI